MLKLVPGLEEVLRMTSRSRCNRCTINANDAEEQRMSMLSY
jgi:hypothetical protein